MAHEIFRVDLSEAACDFQPTATEPGLPMLDSIGANDAILRRWLGDLIAEPDWRPDDRVAFYVRHGQRSRLEEVDCRPTTKDDLEGPLREQVERLADGIRRARPGSSNERLLHRIVQQTFERLRSDPERAEVGFFLMKYRVGKDPWRLIWCWGYQRIDNRPAQPVICRNPECKWLFATRQGSKALCPGCQSVTAGRRRRGGAFAALRSGALAICVLLLLMALVAYWFWPRISALAGIGGGSPDETNSAGLDNARQAGQGRPGFQGTDGSDDAFDGIPASLTLAVGERFDFELGDPAENAISIQSTDTDVVLVDVENCVEGRLPGEATIELRLGGRKRTVPVKVSEVKFTSLRIEAAGEPVAAVTDETFWPHDPVGSPRVPVPPHVTRVRPVGPGGSDARRPHAQPIPPDVIISRPIGPTVIPGGEPGHEIPRVTPTVPVAVRSWRPLDATAEQFVPELDLQVSERAEYRVVGLDGTELSPWSAGGPDVALVIRCVGPIDRSAGGEYELIVERRIPGKQIKQFHVPFSLKPSGT